MDTNEHGKHLSRRDVLKLGLGAGAIAGAKILGVDKALSQIIPLAASQPTRPQESPEQLPKGLPKDVLNKKELEAANITINQSNETRLFLRKGALDLPIFKDAKAGRTKGIVISLIDSENLSWNAIDKLPEDAKLVWQALDTPPSEWRETYWQDLSNWHQKRLSSTQENLQREQTWLDEITSGQKKKQITESIERANANMNEAGADKQRWEFWYDQRKFWQDQLDQLPAEEKRIRGMLKYDQQAKTESDKMVELLKDRKATIDYFMEHDGPQGKFINPRLLKDYGFPADDHSPTAERFRRARSKTDTMEKVYIYIAVGGQYKPNPSQSFPRPEQFHTGNDPTNTSYDVFSDETTAGWIVRHESAHYNDPDIKPHDEYEADHGALKTITDAWNHYQATGDNSGYVFVFVNDKGITITKKTDITPVGSQTT